MPEFDLLVSEKCHLTCPSLTQECRNQLLGPIISSFTLHAGRRPRKMGRRDNCKKGDEMAGYQ